MNGQFRNVSGGMKVTKWLFIPLVVIILILIIFRFSPILVVPAGHVAVLTLFGKVDPDELPEGLHIINPLKRAHIMSVRTQEVTQSADVPSKEGLTVGLDVSLLFHLSPDKASEVYKTVGENYVEVLVIPVFRSAIRNVTVNYEAKALYTSGRDVIAQAIHKELEEMLLKRGIVVEKVLLRAIRLPKMVEEAINNKLAAEQEAERMKYILEKERQEAERKRIEAQGIADFQRIVSEGIDDRYLKWKALETVNKLAESPNSKFVILGDKSGLPIIVNTEK